MSWRAADHMTDSVDDVTNTEADREVIRRTLNPGNSAASASPRPLPRQHGHIEGHSDPSKQWRSRQEFADEVLAPIGPRLATGERFRPVQTGPGRCGGAADEKRMDPPAALLWRLPHRRRPRWRPRWGGARCAGAPGCRCAHVGGHRSMGWPQPRSAREPTRPGVRAGRLRLAPCASEPRRHLRHSGLPSAGRLQTN
jgi:hypothetical protein